MNIVICFDDKFLHPGLIWLHNLNFVTPREVIDKISVYIGYEPSQLSHTSREEISSLAEHFSLNITFEEISITEYRGVSQASLVPTFLAKFSRFHFMYSMKEPFLYFDVDTLLLPGWHEIWSFTEELVKSGKVLGAAKDFWSRAFPQSTRSSFTILLPEGFFGDIYDRYFNSGVICVNPKAWEPVGFDEVVNIWRFLQEKGSVLFDQDVLNFLFAKDYLEIPDTFNEQGTDPFMWEVARKLSSCNSPKILHFCGQAKPWLQEKAWKEDFALSLVDESCSKPFRLGFLMYHLAENRYRVFRKNFLT